MKNSSEKQLKNNLETISPYADTFIKIILQCLSGFVCCETRISWHIILLKG